MVDFVPNYTAFLQAVLLVGLWLVLKKLVFDRFLGVLADRESRTTGALDEAKALREEAATLRAEYEEAMARVRREAADARESIRREAESEERSLLEAARADASTKLDDVRGRVREELDAARAELEAEVDGLADRITEKLLGGKTP